MATHALQSSVQPTLERGARRAVKRQFRRLEGCKSKVDVDAVTLTGADMCTAFVESEALLVVAPDDFLEFTTGKRESLTTPSPQPPDSNVNPRRSGLAYV